MQDDYYAYVHCKPDGTPFYVGKGTLRRSRSLSSRNIHHRHTVDKYGAENIVMGRLQCSSDSIAFELEAGIIKCLKRMGVSLTNYTEGGVGAPGVKVSKETREKQARSQRGRKHSEDTKLRIAASHKRRTYPKASEETKIKMAEAHRGRVHSEEAKIKISMSGKGRIFTEAHKHHIAEGRLGVSPANRKVIVGVHPTQGTKEWQSIQLVAQELGVWRQSIQTHIKRLGTMESGWVLRFKDG